MNNTRHSSLSQRGGLKRRQKKVQHAHGWSRASDSGQGAARGTGKNRRATGTPFLLFLVVTVMTLVGLARVRARLALLELGEEIGDLTQEQAALLDEKRRLETERAYLRHPNRIRSFAEERLDMHPADPQRIQSIELLVKTEELPPVPEDESADPAEPQVPQGVQP